MQTAIDCLSEHVPLEMTGDYSPQDLFEILLRAASRRDSVEHTVRQLEGAPSGNGIRYHLDKLNDMATVEQQLNRALQSRIPPKITKHSQRLAIDLHLIPHYGTPTDAETPYIYRSQAKAGTTTFFAYATMSSVATNE